MGRRAIALLVLAVSLTYAGGLRGPFVFDDVTSIEQNASIRDLRTALSPPSSGGETVGGRPLLNLSFALNYAIGGLDVVGYHVVNVLIHLLAALALFGIVRGTLARLADTGAWGGGTVWPAFSAALLWSLHPLQTASVTYTVQRAESLAALFGLLALLAFVRATSAGRPIAWLAASVSSCALAMATKEVAAVVPLLVLLYDRTFVAGSLREAWGTRRGYYSALAATWVLLVALVSTTGGRGGTAGLGTEASWSTYAVTQAWAITHYLRLALWPNPLVFDYGTDVRPLAEVWPHVVFVGASLAAIAWAVAKRPLAGFLAAWFVVTLAPSSSVIPVATQPIAEHRMYLPLAALVTAAVLLLWSSAPRHALAITMVAAIGLGYLTARRNVDYRTEDAIWASAVAARPTNVRALLALGLAEYARGRPEEAFALHERALRLDPENVEAHNGIAMIFFSANRLDQAKKHYRRALASSPRSVRTRCNYAAALTATGSAAEAVALLDDTLAFAPAAACIFANRGIARLHLGAPAEAIADFETSLSLDADQPVVHANYGNTLLIAGRGAEARAHYEEALRLEPGYEPARSRLAELAAK